MQGKECIPIQEITSFQEYPEIGVKWNSCVLESYLFKDKDFCKFCLLQAGGQVSSWGAYGVIAKKGSIAVKDYKSAVIYLLARSHDWNDVDGALECIISMGLQATRKMKDIEEIVKVARAERARITPLFRGKACMRK